jgi:dTDP-4-dehydrorhamnose reductase
MRVLLIGATGTIGSAVQKELASRHEIISVGRTRMDVFVDITSPESIKQMYKKVGKVDAVVSTAGATYFGSLKELTPENNEISIQS